MNNTRRKLLKSIPAAGVAGALFALSGSAISAECPAMSKKAQMAMTPEQALQSLKDGNERFINGKMLNCDLMAQVRATASGQFPYAIVLGCIDSRVPPELVFDQGLVIFLAHVLPEILRIQISSVVWSSLPNLQALNLLLC